MGQPPTQPAEVANSGIFCALRGHGVQTHDLCLTRSLLYHCTVPHPDLCLYSILVPHILN